MRKLIVASVVLVIGCSVWFSSLALADQGVEETKHAEKHQAGVPLFDKVPYISRVFKNIGAGGAHGIRIVVDSQGVKAAKCGSQDGPKHFGIDVDVVKCKSAKTPRDIQCEVGAGPGCCKKGAAVAFRQGGCGKKDKVSVTAKCACGDACKCARPAKCACGDGCKCAPATKCAKRDGHKKSGKTFAAFKAAWKLRKELDDARAEKFEIVTELREEFDSERAELFEALAEAKAEIAHLQAHVELAHQKHDLLRSVMTTASENARLKAQLELVSHRHQTQQTVSRIAAENAKLKAHLTKLQEQVATKQRAARTANAPSATRDKK